MSQLELAIEAGTTQRHLSYIETGRSRPGRGMVLRLSEALGLPLRERNSLLLSAGFAPTFGAAALDAPELATIVGAVENVLEGHLPYPAIATSPGGDLVSANRAFHALVDGVDEELLVEPVNVPRLLLDPRGLAPRIINLQTWGWHVIHALRQEDRRNPSPRLDALAAELESFVPKEAAGTASDYIGLATPLRLRHDGAELSLITTLTHFATAVDVAVAELRLEAFLPADPPTAAALFRLGGKDGPR
jgi:hypothetical protein